jgi:hypothetical protein
MTPTGIGGRSLSSSGLTSTKRTCARGSTRA